MKVLENKFNIMDKLDNIHETYGGWPQAVNLSETGITSYDLFNPELINIALSLAEKNPRQRAIVRLHERLSDENHLMINAILGESYVQPHKHEEPEKTETFRIVKGKALIVFFNDGGNVEDKIEISDEADSRKIVTVRPGKWHTVIPMSDETVLLEAKRQPAGGYNPETDKTMAPWAPDQKDPGAGLKYLMDIAGENEKSKGRA